MAQCCPQILRWVVSLQQHVKCSLPGAYVFSHGCVFTACLCWSLTRVIELLDWRVYCRTLRMRSRGGDFYWRWCVGFRHTRLLLTLVRYCRFGQTPRLDQYRPLQGTGVSLASSWAGRCQSWCIPNLVIILTRISGCLDHGDHDILSPEAVDWFQTD